MKTDISSLTAVYVALDAFIASVNVQIIPHPPLLCEVAVRVGKRPFYMSDDILWLRVTLKKHAGVKPAGMVTVMASWREKRRSREDFTHYAKIIKPREFIKN